MMWDINSRAPIGSMSRMCEATRYGVSRVDIPESSFNTVTPLWMPVSDAHHQADISGSKMCQKGPAPSKSRLAMRVGEGTPSRLLSRRAPTRVPPGKTQCAPRENNL